MKVIPALCIFGLSMTLFAQRTALELMQPKEAQPLAHFVTSGDWPLKWIRQTFTEEDQLKQLDGGEIRSAFDALGAFGSERFKLPCQTSANQNANASQALPSPKTMYSSKYGISLRFPRIYRLKEGELGQEVGLGYLGPIPMEFVAPGGVRVVTVVMPPHSYPNTDFNTAFVTLSVNQYLTRTECEQFSESVPGSRETITRTIGGLDFHGLRVGGAGAGHQFGGIYYHAFSQGSCYEVGEGLATSGYGAVDGMEGVDRRDVFARLDDIIQSITINPPKSAVAASPSVESLALSPLLQRSPTGAYRVSWEVKGADDDHIWISASCYGNDLSIFELTGDTPEGSVFTCDVLRSAKSASGSLDLEFRNTTGGAIKDTLRVFAAGHPPASKAVTIDLPPLPVIIALVANGRKSMPPFHDKVIQIVPGRNVEIIGVAFLTHETLSIGSRTFPVTASNRETITFTVPDSLPEGQYPLSIANERGSSNAVTVQILK
jgi:hypothetical protein